MENENNFLTNVILLICRFFRLMMKWYTVESTVAKSVDIEMISTNTEIITRTNSLL
ncbi:hypothetical protein H8356DRAFT_1432983 [Neocallimastix lanati (nom. inval.)]|nr:hypothetical protein H8356DRAFT_1432983 [Neocallimastix sp. JGI-2020a]